MQKMIRIFAFLAIMTASLSARSQSAQFDDFSIFVTKTYKLPESLKYNCEWMYAVVSLKTDAGNKVTKIDFINNVSDSLKTGFNFLLGYQFAKSIKINRHPIVFYFSIDNTEICKAKPGDFIYYSPNRVVEIITNTLLQIRAKDPKTIIIPEMIIQKFYGPQE